MRLALWANDVIFECVCEDSAVERWVEEWLMNVPTSGDLLHKVYFLIFFIHR